MIRGWGRVALAAACVAGASATQVRGQTPTTTPSNPTIQTGRSLTPNLQVLLPPPDSVMVAAPLVRAVNVLGVSTVRELLDHGFPARLTYRIELWRAGGLFDRRVRSSTWDVVLRFDPVRRVYESVLVVNDEAQPIGTFSLLADAVSEIERPHRAPIRPPSRGETDSHYYTATLTLEMISVSDLDELGRWVRGDLNPAVRGRRNPGTAIGRGARTLLSRMLGGERRTIEGRSARFRAE